MTSATSIAPLAGIPEGLREPLLRAFHEIVRNYRAGRWEPSELNGGKLSEVTYTILRGHADGLFPAQPIKPPNLVDACRDLEKAGSHLPRSVRIQIPRVLMALYEVRNNRGVGHVGGDVDPNAMDAALVLAAAKWIMAELVRLFHGLGTAEAQEIVEAIVSREAPTVWEVNGRKRVLVPALTLKDKTLLLLYSQTGSVNEQDLLSWVEHKNAAVYRRDVLRPAHRAKLVEYDETSKTVELSPIGAAYVEGTLPLAIAF